MAFNFCVVYVGGGGGGGGVLWKYRINLCDRILPNYCSRYPLLYYLFPK